MFAAEIIMSCMVIDNYKYSFFFWLDILATASLLPDINWFSDPLMTLFGLPSFQKDADVQKYESSNGELSSQASRILKSFRLIRLIRIVKLYRYCVSTNNQSEANLRIQEKNAQNAVHLFQFKF